MWSATSFRDGEMDHSFEDDNLSKERQRINRFLGRMESSSQVRMGTADIGWCSSCTEWTMYKEMEGICGLSWKSWYMIRWWQSPWGNFKRV